MDGATQQAAIQQFIDRRQASRQHFAGRRQLGRGPQRLKAEALLDIGNE